MKTCTKCKINKPRDEFCGDKRNKNGLQSHCKICQREYRKTPEGRIKYMASMRRYYSTPKGNTKYKANLRKYMITPKGKEVKRNIDLKHRYDITIEEYNKMLEDQGGVCAICGTDKTGGKGRFCVDHDHETDKIRGLLCRNCNLLLGNAKDSIKTILKASQYLSQSKLN